MSEQWLPIPGFPGYEISSLGRIRSILGRTGKIHFLKPDGYRVRILQNGSYVRLNIKRTMYEAFPDIKQTDLNEPGEEWKPIPGWELFYEVSNHYRVRGLERVGYDGKNLNSKLLSVSRTNGYLTTYLCHPGQRSKSCPFYIEAAVENLFGLTPQILDEMSLPDEEWRDIGDYEGLYQISNIGRVRSVGWYVNGGNKRRYARPKLLAITIANTGYPHVTLSIKTKMRTFMIHRLVARAFIPNPLGFDVVHHKDENKLNPRVENLEWKTRGGNVQDWFDRRRVVVSAEMIETIGAALATGKSPDEILASLPRKRKQRKSA